MDVQTMNINSTGDWQVRGRFRHVLSACGRFAVSLRSRLTTERGQALIEFAFLLPVLLLFLLALVDFGLALDRREVIQHAVREGARQASIGLSEAEIEALVVEQSQETLTVADVSVCYADGPGGAPAGFAGSAVRVSATYTYHFSLGSGELLGAFGVDPISVDMTPNAESRLETSVSGATLC